MIQKYYEQRLTYQFSVNILSGLTKDTIESNRSSNYQEAAKNLSFIGNYKNTLMVWDSVHEAPVFTTEDSLYFLRFKPMNAHEYIIARAKKEQILIINEAHHQPNHRVFTESLLHDLYKAGFRYFGGETIQKKDTYLNRIKYPAIFSGTYSREPQYGNMLRAALKEGFYIFAYEADLLNGTITPTEREIQQAQHIKAILDTNPQAKILIHCGYDHLVETDLPGWGKAMAGRLKEYTGIDPFTIDQVRLTESGSLQFDNPYYKMASLDYYAVFVDSAGNFFNGHNLNQYDVRVYHPRTKWIDGRPKWVFENNRSAYYIKVKITVSFPCLVFAYCNEENISYAVPTDVIELRNEEDKVALSLKKGAYIIVVKYMNSNEQKFSAQL